MQTNTIRIAGILLAMSSGLVGQAVAGSSPRTLPRPPSMVGDAKLVDALAELSRVARSSDGTALRRLLAPELADPLDAGHQALEKRWRTRDPRSPFWTQLRRALEIGGAHDAAGRFVLPWPAVSWPPDAPADGHTGVIVSRAPLRAAPSRDARVRAVTGHEILRLAGAYEAVPAGWVKVRTPGRIYGFLRTADVWSPSELQVELGPLRDGTWRIVAVRAALPARTGGPPFSIPRPPRPE